MKENVDRTVVETFLKKLPFLKSLSEKHSNQIIKDFSIISLPKEEIVFSQADKSDDLYIVIEGAVRASLLNAEGEELVVSTFCKGDFFGEMSLFDGRPRSATVIASEDSVLGILRREKFLQAISRDPAIAIELLSAMVRRLRIADEMLESLAFLDVGQRLVKLLQHIGEFEGEKDKSGFVKIKRLTHKEIASRTGASREAISKALKVLAFRGLVKEEGGFFLVSPDMADY